MPDSFSSSLEIFLFGPPVVRLDGQLLHNVYRRKGPLVLAYLALRKEHRASRNQLAADLWPDSFEAENVLKMSLSNLRTALGKESYRLTSPVEGVIAFDFSDVFVDVLVFNQAIAKQDEDLLEHAMLLQERGLLLEGVDDIWFFEPRRRRWTQWLHALERNVRSALARGDHQIAAEYLFRSAGLPPCEQPEISLWVELQEALIQKQKYRFAVQVCQKAVAFLQSWDKQETAEAVRTLQRVANKIPPHARAIERASSAKKHRALEEGVPFYLTAFVGRTDLKARVKTALDHSRLVCLCGTGGVGKTRLAVQTLQEQRQEYDGGIVFLDLAAVQDDARLFSYLAARLHSIEQASKDLRATVLAHLNAKRWLIVLDNCEHLAAVGSFAQDLLENCPGVKVLATSREDSLGIPGEKVLLVPPLSVPETHDGPGDLLPELALQFDAIRLFALRVEEVQEGFRLTGGNAGIIARICRLLCGLPLALEIVASNLRAIPLEQIEVELTERLLSLHNRYRSVNPRHSSLQASLDWSYYRLEPNEQALFRRLTVFQGPFTRDEAKALCEGETLAPSFEAWHLLTRLVEKSLVVSDSESYWLLAVVRQYGRRCLDDTGEQESVLRRHFTYYYRLAIEAHPGMRGADQVQWLDRLDAALNNIRAAILWGLQQAALAADCIELVTSLERFWIARGHFLEGIEYLQKLLQLPMAAERTLARARILQVLALLYTEYHLHDPLGPAMSRESLEIYREQGSRGDLALALRRLANTLFFLHSDEGLVRSGQHGLPEEALQYAKEAMALCVDLGDSESLVDVQCDMANWLLNMARQEPRDSPERLAKLRQAEAWYRERLTVVHRNSDLRGIAHSLLCLGWLKIERDDLTEAESLARETLLKYAKLRDTPGVMYAFDLLGSIRRHWFLNHKRQGMLYEAARLYAVEENLRLQLQRPLPPEPRLDMLRTLLEEASCIDQASEDALYAAWKEGKELTVTEAIEYVHALPP